MVAHNFDMEEVMEIEHTFGKSSKKPSDVNAPKRNLSAYFLWANKKRPQVMKDNEGAGVAVIGKALGDMWKKTSDSDRAPFVKKAAAEKKSYQAKREKYEKSGHYKKHQMTLLAWKIHETKKPFRKDENAPKRSLSAYMHYAASVRSKILKENPDIAASDVMREQSVWWKALGNSDRQKWNDKAAADKKKYETKLNRYMKTADYQGYVTDRDAYKLACKEKRNKLMGIKKRARTPTKTKSAPRSPSKKKAKKARRSRTPKASKSKSRSVSRRRRAKSPKSPKRRSRKRRAEKRKSRAPKATKKRSVSRKSRTPKASKSRSASRASTSRSASRRSSKRRARTPKAPKAKRSRSAKRRSRTPKASRSRSAKRRSRTPKASKRSKSRSKSRRSSSRKSKSPRRRSRRSSTRSKSRRKSTSRRRKSKKKAAAVDTDTSAAE